MKLLVNKKETEMVEGTTVGELLTERNLSKASVWVNGTQLLWAEYERHVLKEGDEVKLLRIVAGG